MQALPRMVHAVDINLDTDVVYDAYTGERLTNEVIDRMNDEEDRRYGLIPGVSEVVDLDLDRLNLHDLNGNPITEESCERDADEAERRFFAGLVPGGKSLNGDGTHSPVLRLVVSRDTKTKIKEAAEAEHMSVSRWLRRTVEEKLAA